MGGLSLGPIEQMLEKCVYLCFYSRGATSLAVVALKIMLTLTWELNLVSGN